MGRRGDWDWFEPAKRREAKGGIKAGTRRGAFATSWWGKRWIEVLEGFDIGARLSRGRSYARSGQVTDLVIKPGEVRANVQGSRAAPYGITIWLKTFGQKDWSRIAKVIAGKPLVAAKLLAGEMPEELEEIVRSAGLNLFPAREGDLGTECSCPDWSNPCKHIAAVYYLLAEAFDKDPFLLLTLRGLDHEGFLALIGGTGGAQGAAAPETPLDAPPAAPSAEPLPTDHAAFWTGRPIEMVKGAARGPDPAALVKRLGPLPFWRGREDFVQTMAAAYASAARDADNYEMGRSES